MFPPVPADANAVSHLTEVSAYTFTSATALTVSSVASSKQAILPVILMEILGSEIIKKQGNLLLDSGAQVSSIKLSVADELGLKGKEVTITIAKVGGEEEELITKLFRVRIRSLVSRNVIHTVTAVGIPCISTGGPNSRCEGR